MSNAPAMEDEHNLPSVVGDNTSESFIKEENDSSRIKDPKDDVFKKPSFIGSKRGIKGPKKPLNANTFDIENSQKAGSDEKEDQSPTELVAETKKNNNFPPLPYTEPIWKGTTKENYTLEELKSGVIQNIIDLQNKSFIVFGRIDCCDVVMAHPTISRYHAVLQYRGVPDGDEEKGFYLYDLDSTHGTFLNKARLKPNVYARVRVGHMIKLGCSSRFFLLQGPEFDQEDESDLTFTELKEKRKQELLEKKRQEEEELRLKEEEEEKQLKLIEERGISWGLGEDAEEEEDLSENPYAVTTNEEMYIDDPKKALKQWFEREGEEMHLETEQVEKGMMACKIIIPLDDEKGQEITIESSARTKKEAQTQCCLEACRTIDRMGLFRQAKQEAKRRQTRNWEENDYYDSDEDSFLDRTGDLEMKRQKRMRKVGKIQETIETYESLMEKHSVVLKELTQSERKLEKLLAADQSNTAEEDGDGDALDAFMNNLKHDKPGKLDIKIAKDEVAKLKKEENHLRKLINIVKPTSLPELIPPKVPLMNNIESSSKIKERTKAFETNSIEKTNIVTDNDNKFKNNESTKKRKVAGPVLPANAPAVNAEINQAVYVPSEKSGSKGKNKIKKKAKLLQEDETKMDEDFTNLVWRPPKGQTGDGRTSLNDKLGY